MVASAQTVSGTADSEWLTDYVFQFMKNGSSWSQPIQEFIDRRCNIFDLPDPDENKLEYTRAHHDFQDFVDSLLAAHLLEVDASPEDFAVSFELHSQSDLLLDSIVEQLVSAGAFVAFKKMMGARNLELQRQQVRQGLKVLMAECRGSTSHEAGLDKSPLSTEAVSSGAANEVEPLLVEMQPATLEPAVLLHAPTPGHRTSRTSRTCAIAESGIHSKKNMSEKAAIIRSALTASLLSSRLR